MDWRCLSLQQLKAAANRCAHCLTCAGGSPDATKAFSKGCALRRSVTVATLCQKVYEVFNGVHDVIGVRLVAEVAMCLRQRTQQLRADVRERPLSAQRRHRDASNKHLSKHWRKDDILWHTEHVFGACFGGLCDWLSVVWRTCSLQVLMLSGHATDGSFWTHDHQG